ncbi:MAG: TIGR04283 family arsenosugar biosynthesis glycosyltransferase [Nitrospira sp.]|nr:TIGR04283 family arsenosugar biosynthesis glycosyltransferase [Nitrospira sp.]
MQLSIVVPMLNEADQLPDLLEHLSPLSRQGAEVILVDGGSSDDSVAMARAGGFQVIDNSPGRARQMNAGAWASMGDVLLFLHADTRLPEGAMMAIEQAMHRHKWGRFDVRIAGRSSTLRLVASLMNWRSRLSGIATGDQGIFVSRSVFNSIGGYPELPLMEDIDICRALKKIGKPACLRLRVLTSGRRWEQRGVWRTILLMWWLRWRYWLGAPVEEIAKAYR